MAHVSLGRDEPKTRAIIPLRNALARAAPPANCGARTGLTPGPQGDRRPRSNCASSASLSGGRVGPQSVTIPAGVTVKRVPISSGLAAEVDACAGPTYRALGAVAWESWPQRTRLLRARLYAVGTSGRSDRKNRVGRAMVGVVVTAVMLAACGDPGDLAGESMPTAARDSTVDVDIPISTTTWRFSSLEVDGEAVPVDQALFLDVAQGAFQASTPCNDVGGQFGGDLRSTAMGCPDEVAVIEDQMTQAFGTEPVEIGGQLIFDNGDIRLVYDSFVDPQPSDLFAVLGDASASVDESRLPSEQVTGTVPPDFESLVPVPSPAGQVDLFIGVLGGNVCLVYGTTATMDMQCSPPRIAATSSYAIDIPKYDEPLIRVALIPDRYSAAVATRTDLGTYEANILTLVPDAPTGEHLLIDDGGEHSLLSIPPPWTDPMVASRTDPEQ